jgi:NADH-quinone oxidoreductase subunit F
VPQPTDDELIATWASQPAPLLPLLHAFHDRDGYLSDDAIRTVAQGLKMPVADLFGTVTFYHHFSRTPGGLEQPRVCLLYTSPEPTRHMHVSRMPSSA